MARNSRALAILTVTIFTGVAILLILFGTLWIRLINDPDLRTSTDFVSFYAAGQIARHEGSAQIYDLKLQQKYEEALVGYQISIAQVNPFIHPAYLLPLLQLVISTNYVSSYIRWAVLMIALFLANAILMGSLVGSQNQRVPAWVAAAGALLFFPSFLSILNGQDTALLLLGAALWLYGLLKGQDRLAGLGLALTTVRPHLTLVLAIPFLFNRRLVWWWFLAGASALALISMLILGAHGTVSYLNLLLVSGRGDSYHINETAMVNLIGLLSRTCPGLSNAAIRQIGWGFYLSSILGLCIIWAKSKTLDEKLAGSAVLLCLFTAPHLHYHDLALLLIPLFGLIRMITSRGLIAHQKAAVIPLVSSFVLLLSTLIPVLKYPVVYLAMLVLGIWLWFPEKIHGLIIPTTSTNQVIL